MNPVRIRFWLKNDEFLQASIDYDDVMAINEAYGKVKAGVVRNENLKITISNITFHVDDIAKASCWYGYLFADEPLSSVTIVYSQVSSPFEHVFDRIKYSCNACII